MECVYAANISLSYCWFVCLFTLTANVLRVADVALCCACGQGNIAYTLLWAGYSPKSFFFNESNSSFEMIPFSNNVEYFNNSSALDC